MDPNRSLFVLKNSNGSVWVLIFTYALLWTVMGPYMGAHESLWVLLGLFGSLLVFMRLYVSL